MFVKMLFYCLVPSSQLTEVVDQATSEVTGLHGKVGRLKNVMEHNKTALESFTSGNVNTEICIFVMMLQESYFCLFVLF